MSELLKNLLDDDLKKEYISALSETEEVVFKNNTVEGVQYNAHGVLATLLLASINNDAERCLELAKQLNQVNLEYFAEYQYSGRPDYKADDPLHNIFEID
jgi:hypothetical protein